MMVTVGRIYTFIVLVVFHLGNEHLGLHGLASVMLMEEVCASTLEAIKSVNINKKKKI